MPPYAERKIRLAATMPRKSICVSSAPTQNDEKMSGASTATTSAPRPTRRSGETSARRLTPLSRTARADDERDREGQLDVDPERRDHGAVVDTRADDHAGARPLQPEPEHESDPERDEEDHEPRPRVEDPAHVQVREFVEPPRPRDVLR